MHSIAPSLHFMKFRPDAITPCYQTAGAAGLDLHAARDFLLRRGSDPIVVPTGIGIALPPGFEAQVRPRSSLSKRGIYVALGTIDSDYRGEIGVIISAAYFPSDTSLLGFKAGDRIAQLVIAPVAHFNLVEVPKLDETVRGTKGFGSTGR